MLFILTFSRVKRNCCCIKEEEKKKKYIFCCFQRTTGKLRTYQILLNQKTCVSEQFGLATVHQKQENSSIQLPEKYLCYCHKKNSINMNFSDTDTKLHGFSKCISGTFFQNFCPLCQLNNIPKYDDKQRKPQAVIIAIGMRIFSEYQ